MKALLKIPQLFLTLFLNKNKIKIKKKKNERHDRIRRNILISVLGFIASLALIFSLYFVPWSGISSDSIKTKSIENTIVQGKVVSIKETETETFESYKTLWDWLELAGIIAIPVVLFQFSRMEEQKADNLTRVEQEQQEHQKELEREIAASNLREDSLERYIDRMSELLVDKNLNVESDKPIKDVARIITITILRRLENDKERINRILYFLRDSKLLSFVLEGAILNSIDLSNADLTGVNFSKAKLEGANFSNTIFREANFQDADLSNSKISSANLEGANFSNCNLFQAHISHIVNPTIVERNENISIKIGWVDFTGANLVNSIIEYSDLRGVWFEDADLSLSQLKYVELQYANLSNAKFKDEIFLPPGKNLSMRRGQIILLKNWQTGKPVSGKTRFFNVNLNYAKFDFADLSGVAFEDACTWEKALYSGSNTLATLPDDFDSSGIELIFEHDQSAPQSNKSVAAD